jgi:putative selenium metabolism protein SsnA
MATTLIKNGTIITLGQNNKVLNNHAVSIEDDKIKDIKPSEQFEEKDFKVVIDAGGKVVMPGLINAHMHFYSTFAKGLGKAEPSANFHEVLKNLWWRLDKKLVLDDCYYSALYACIDAIKHGTTTIIDHHASPFAIRGSLNKIADAVLKTGVRANLCYELSDRDGDKIAAEGIEENIDFIKRCNSEKSDKLKALFGLHASFTIGDATLKKASDEGNKLGVGFHIHTAEDKLDQELCEKEYKIRVVERLKKFKILGPKTICAHCIHINDDEMDLLKQSDTIAVTNPQSNMNNAVGVANTLKLSAKKIILGLGTDAMTINMLEELRSAMWIQKLYQKDPSCGFMETVNTLFLNNSQITGRYWEGGIGVLNEGNKADIIIVDYYPPTEFDENTFFGHAVYGISQSPVDTTICDGKILMQNKKLVDIDEIQIASECRKLAKTLWERF